MPVKKHLLCLITSSLTFCLWAQIDKPEAEAVLITRMGDEYLKAGVYDQAIYYYKEALAIYPGYVKTEFQLAQCYRLALQSDSAFIHYQSIISNEQDVRYPMSRYHLAMMLLDKNEFQAARENLITFRTLLIENKLHELKKYRDFYKQAKTEIDKLGTK